MIRPLPEAAPRERFEQRQSPPAAMQSLWQSCLKQLEKELPAQQFNTWIRPLNPTANGADELRLTAPNRFVLQWVKERFLTRIEAMLAEQSGKPMRVVLGLSESDAAAEVAAPRPPLSADSTSATTKVAGDRKPAERL